MKSKRADIQHCCCFDTMLRLVFHGPTERNFLRLWFPEIISSDKRDLPTQIDRIVACTGRERTVLLEKHSPVGVGTRPEVSAEGQISENEYGYELELTVRNLTDKPLPLVTPAVCMQLSAAVDFVDTSMQRTYVRVSGTPVLLCETRREWHDPRTQKYYLETATVAPPDNATLTYDGTNHWGVSATRIDSPLIVAHSRLGDWNVGIRFDDAQTVSNNAKPFMACLHSTPTAAVMPPASMARFHGQIVIVRGAVADVFDDFG